MLLLCTYCSSLWQGEVHAGVTLTLPHAPHTVQRCTPWTSRGVHGDALHAVIRASHMSIRRQIPLPTLPSAPEAQAGHHTHTHTHTSRYRPFNLAPSPHSSASRMLFPRGNIPHTSCPPPATRCALDPSPEVAASDQHHQLAAASGRRNPASPRVNPAASHAVRGGKWCSEPPAQPGPSVPSP